MKTFISFIPQQEEGKLHLTRYVPQGNQRLAYGPTRFPILPVINGYTQPGEEIRVLLIVQDYKWCRHNEAYFHQELKALCAEKGLIPQGDQLYTRIEVPFDDGVSSHIETFQKLIDHIRDGDDLHACITYGSKPAPMVELMALRYARQVRKNTYISCIVYGQYDRVSGETRIYDETALAHLDDIIRVLVEHNDPNPKETLDRIIAL